MAMTSDNELGIVVRVTDLSVEGIESARKNMQKFSADTEMYAGKGSVALKGFSFAAKGLAHELGVSGGMARVFGHEAADMAMMLGRAATPVGIATIAVIAATKVYSHFTEEQKKLREETLKSSDTAMAWIESMRVSTRETNTLREANDRLWKSEKDRSQWNLEKGIDAQTTTVSDLSAKIDAARSKYERYSGALDSVMNNIFIGSPKKRKEDLKDAEIDYENAVAKLQKMYALSSGAGPLRRKGDTSLSPAFTTFQFEQMQEWMLLERGKQERQKSLGDESTYLSARAALYSSYGAIAEEIYQADLAAFDAVTTAKLNSLTNEDAQKEYFSQREMERMGRVAAYERSEEEKRLKVRDQAIQNTVAGFQLLSQQHGSYARKYFEVYKYAAISQTAIATREAAMGAYAALAKIPYVGPYLGAAAAAAAILYGGAQIQAIRQQTFDGGSGAVGTYAANPATGNAENGGYKYFNYEQSQYGSGWRPGQGQGAVTINIHGDVYDADKFQEKVSAAWNSSAKTNEYGVRDTARRYV